MDQDSPNVLVVDDEPLVTQALCEALELQQYRPRAAFNGRQALDEIRREQPDLIVLDIGMPLMDGLQVLKLVRSDPSTQETPVIMLTGFGSDADVVRGIRAGATMYLTKPVEVRRVLALVTAILRPKAAH